MTGQPRFRFHFDRRWAERGLPDVVDAATLRAMLREGHKAWRETGIEPDWMERCHVADKPHDGSDQARYFWRIVVEGVPFYVIMVEATGLAVTIYDQRFYSKKKRYRRTWKRLRSERSERGKEARRQGHPRS